MTMRGKSGSGRGAAIGFGRRGVATVEMAILLPLMLLLIFGTLEVGLMAKQSHSLNHVAREMARVASIGAPNSQISAHMAAVAPGLDCDRIGSSIQYRAWEEGAGTWGAWTTLTDDGVENSASSGDQIRVKLTYSYQLATGGMLADTLNASADNVVTVNATIVSMRE